MQALAHIKKNSSDLAVVKQLVDQAYARTRTYLRTRTYTFILRSIIFIFSIKTWSSRSSKCSAMCCLKLHIHSTAGLSVFRINGLSQRTQASSSFSCRSTQRALRLVCRTQVSQHRNYVYAWWPTLGTVLRAYIEEVPSR